MQIYTTQKAVEPFSVEYDQMYVYPPTPTSNDDYAECIYCVLNIPFLINLTH